MPAPPEGPIDTATTRQRADSLRADSVKADTLRAPLARAEAPTLPETGHGWHWDRQELFATGALTLGELLDQIPGAVMFRPSWIHSPETVSFLGDPGAVRVFVDGIEIDELDPRNGRVLDVDEIQLWPMEEVRVERGARELRVHMRTWRYDRTIPNTRVDVATGDQATNLYRAFFGQRYKHGEALQFGVQQFSTTDPLRRIAASQAAGGRSLSVMLRTGWARRGWSVDGFLLRNGWTRNPELAYTTRTGPHGVQLLGTQVADSIPALRAVRTDVYLRGGYGDPESGPWLQALAASSLFSEATGQDTSRLAPIVTKADSLRGSGPPADTTPSRAQYVIAGGLSRWGARLSATARTRIFDGRTITSPSARASFETRFGAVSARAERNGFNHAATLEAGISAIPIPWVSLSAVAERTQGANDGSPGGSAARGEVGVRYRQAWITAGALYRDSILAAVPWVYYSDFTPDSAGHPPSRIGVSRARGGYLSIQGKLYRDAGLEATATRWTSPDLFRPQVDARVDIFLRTRWLSRFPDGDFGVNANLYYDYRSTTRFPIGGPTAASLGTTTAPGSQIVSAMLELHIRSAYITWQYRNLIGTGTIYSLVPGYLMTRATNIYGVRWEFFN